MINLYTSQEPGKVLEIDPAGEFPIYIYLSSDKSILLYSNSIIELLNDDRIPKPLKVNMDGISFLLQSGAVPPPKTVYENIYILGIGYKANISSINNKINIKYDFKFPFINNNRLSASEMQPDEDLILQMIAEATISRIDLSKSSFLFHSAGKDSNTIALALAEAGWQDKVTLITHKSKGEADESKISFKIAKRLGFNHKTLYENDKFFNEHKKAISEYFFNSPLPCTDNVTLAYPLYTVQLPDLKNANIIDGMGNDVFIGHIPSRSEYKGQQISKYLKYTRVITKYFPSESLIQPVGRARPEWTGLFGTSFSDTQKIMPQAIDVYRYWSKKDTNQDYLDLRAFIRGTIIDKEIFTRKIQNFTDSVKSKIILPFTNKKVAEYFAKIPEQYLFDRKSLKNKLILRKILKDRIDLDSDLVGKMGFSIDTNSIVINNWDWIFEEMTKSSLWSQSGLIEVVNRLKSIVQQKHKYSNLSARLIYRIYLLSAWHNQCKYL